MIPIPKKEDRFFDEGDEEVEITHDEYIKSVNSNTSETAASSHYNVHRNKARNVFIPIIILGILSLTGLYLFMYGPWYKSSISSSTAASSSLNNYMQCDIDLNGTIEIFDNETGIPKCCNGLKSNCNYHVNEVMFATVHNAMSSKSDLFFAANNILPIEEALEAGYRGLFLDSCICANGKVQFCHTVCKGGTRDPLEVFRNIKRFLDENRSEVIIIEIEVNHESLGKLYEVMMSVDGFREMLYAHPSTRVTWPLMSTLISDNTRLLIFQHNGPNCYEEQNGCPYGIHDTFENMYDTPYEMSSNDVLNYQDISCTIDRGEWGYKSFFIINHYGTNTIGLSDDYDARLLNQYSYVEKHVNACQKIQNQYVSMFVVNFWEYGNVVEYTQDHNNMLGNITFDNKLEFKPVGNDDNGGSSSYANGGAVPIMNFTADATVIPALSTQLVDVTAIHNASFEGLGSSSSKSEYYFVLNDDDNMLSSISNHSSSNSEYYFVMNDDDDTILPSISNQSYN